jgi:hypothetical protein
MGHVVVHKGEMSEKAYRAYLLLVSRYLLEQGIGLDRVPRTEANGCAGRWLYVFADEAAARRVTEELTDYTEEGWEVRPAEGSIDVGPLRPITVEAGWGRTGVGFGLDPLIRKALQDRFPGAAPHNQVWVDTDDQKVYSTSAFRKLAFELMPVLTGLKPQQLSLFGGFEIVDPVKEEVLVPFTPFELPVGDGPPPDLPTHSDSATSPDRCTVGHPD